MFENVLIDYDGRRSLFKMGKLGILWELDRTTGKFLAAYDLGYQNVVDVDPQTGQVTYRPEMIPKAGVEMEFCPTFLGVRNWRATAYHPDTQALYIPIHPSCVKGGVQRGGEAGTQLRATTTSTGILPPRGGSHRGGVLTRRVPTTSAISSRWTSRAARYCGSTRCGRVQQPRR